MSDTASPSASEPIAPPEPLPASGPVAPPVNPYVTASAAATAQYQPVPTSPPPAALTPYSTQGAAYAYAPRTNPLAITSLVLSLVGLITWITAIAGVITGHVALSQIKRTGEGGRGMALAGIIVGYVLTGFFLLYILLMVFVFVGIGATRGF